MELIRVVWWFLGRRLRKSGYRPFLVNVLGALFGFLLFFGLFSAYYIVLDLNEQVDALSNRVRVLEYLLNQKNQQGVLGEKGS